MGRLTLNVLLSFAQFERESPRSASGTRLPPQAEVSGSAVPALGYEMKDGKIAVVETKPTGSTDLPASRTQRGPALVRDLKTKTSEQK